MIQPRKPWKILLLGDTCVDEYHYGVVDRISPEAPVPVFKHEYTETKPGMAANVAKNLRAFGCTVEEIYGPTIPKKCRYIDTRHKHMLIRIDYEEKEGRLLKFNPKSSDYDAIVISDYDKGSVHHGLIYNLGNDYPDIPIFVDTKKTDLSEYNKFPNMFFKLNEWEYKCLKTTCDNTIVTIGDEGAMYKDQIFSTYVVDVADVCGAGDTFLAALAFRYLETAGNITEAIMFANRAASITVQHTGVYAPSLEEIYDA